MKLSPLLLVLMLCLSSVTTAQETDGGSWKPDTHRSGAGAEIFLWDEFYLVADVTDDGLGGDDRAQVAMEPYLAYTNERFFVRLGLRQVLDEPLGFAFDDGRVVSGHLTVGGSWD